jgi:hypothetical protein
MTISKQTTQGVQISLQRRRYLRELQGLSDIRTTFLNFDEIVEKIRNSGTSVQFTLSVSRPGTLLVFHDTVVCIGVALTWLISVREKLIRPIAEYICDAVPLGIGVGEVL